MVALEGSIAAWIQKTEIAMGGAVFFGSAHCPLCGECKDFDDDNEPCKTCPICIDTGFAFCEETPFDAAANYNRGGGNGHEAEAAMPE